MVQKPRFKRTRFGGDGVAVEFGGGGDNGCGDSVEEMDGVGGDEDSGDVVMVGMIWRCGCGEMAAKVNTFVHMDSDLMEGSKKAKADTKQESSTKRAVPEDGDDVTIDATPLSTRSPNIVDYKIYKEGKKSDRFKKTEPENYMDNYLLLTLKTMFEHHFEDSIWKKQQGLTKVNNWKLFDSCGVYCVTIQSLQYYLLVEKKYPLTYNTLHQMFNDVKLQVDYECEMAYELLRLVKRQLKEGYVPE
ncbi:hypothetical protein Tco_0427730 [Tanacetum coccineum]